MADSDITVSGLVATGGANQILLAWNNPVDPHRNGLPYLQLDAIEVHFATVNNRNNATLLGESNANSFVHSGIARGARFYYWLRPRDRSGLYGEFYPASASAGVTAIESNADVLLEPNGFRRYPDDRVEEWGVGESHNEHDEPGYLSQAFQTQFTEMFGIDAIGVPRTPLEDVSVSLMVFGTNSLTLRTFAGGEPVNGITVYWRVFGI